jgi:MFS family permease
VALQRGSRRRPLWGFLAAEAISFVGNKTTMVALPWLVLTTTGSLARVGLVAFAQTGCYVLVRAFGGPVIDRLGRRRCAIGGSLVSAVLIGLVPALWAGGALPWWVLAALMGPLGAVQSLSDAAKRLMVPDLVSAEGPSLERVTSLYSTVERLSFVLASPAAGLMIAVMGAVNVFAVEAVACLVSAALIWLYVKLPEAARAEAEALPYLRSIREGLRYIRGDRLLLAICVLLWCTNLFDQALFAVFIPSWIKDTVDDPAVLGTIAGAFGLGSAIGAFGYAWLAPRMSRYLTFSLGMLLAGPASFFALGLTDDLLSVLAVFFFSGIASGPINPIISSAMFERVPQPMQARVFGFTGSLAWAGIPVGSLYGGFLADSAGLRAALLITGGLYLAITLSPLLIRAPWRGLNRPEPAYSSTQ